MIGKNITVAFSVKSPSLISRFTLTAVLFILALPTAHTCGFRLLGEDYRIALFNPYLSGSEYELFFYSADRFHPGTNAQAGRDRVRNARAWADELANGVTPEHVLEILYPTTAEQWHAANAGRPDSLFRANPVWKVARQRPDLLNYLLFAKDYESPRLTERSFWYDEENAEEGDAGRDFYAEAREAYTAARGTNDFLEHRWAYQLLLQAYYAEDEALFNQLFNQHFRDDQGVLADWARFQFASFHLGADPRARVMLANAFRNTPEKARAAFQRLGRELNPTEYFSYARSPAERSNLYAVAAFKNPGRALSQIQAAYRLDPENPLIEILLIREINKLEDWLMTNELTGNTPSIPSAWDKNLGWFGLYEASMEERRAIYAGNRSRDRALLRQLRKFLGTYRASSPQMLGLMRAHVALLDEDYAAARRLVPIGQSLTEAEQLQMNIIVFLSLLQGDQTTLSEKKQELVEWLPTLERQLDPSFDLTKDYHAEQRPTGHPIGALSRVTAQILAAAGDTVSAYFFFNRSLPLTYRDGYQSNYYQQIDYLDREVSYAVLDGVLAVITDDQPSAFGQLLQQGARTQVQSVLDVAGTVALRRNDLDRALTYFERIEPQWYAENYAFAEYLTESPFTKPFSTPSPFPGKAAVVRRLVELEQTAKQGGDTGARACYELANAWYQMSSLGNSWMMTSYGHSDYSFPDTALPWPSTNGDASLPHSDTNLRSVFRAHRATAYADCVAAATNNPELLAQTDYLRGLLQYESGLAYRRDYAYYPYNQIRADSLHEASFGRWQENYAATRFYATAAGQCSALR